MDLLEIYNILSHPIRKQILLILEHEGYIQYTDLLDQLKLETTGQLNFHLKKLGPLIRKDKKSYSLTAEGKRIIKIMNINDMLLSGEDIELLDLSAQKNNELNRVGVIICNCNTEISSTIDIQALENYIQRIRNVVSVKILDNFCQQKYLKNIEDWVKENFISKIVIGACSPRSHQHVFERIFDGIIDKQNIEYANIREQCAWVHSKRKLRALKKAQLLIEAAVERVILQQKISQKKVEIVKKVAILGGGIAGMTLSLNLSRAGIKVYLIEKSPTLGGKVARWDRIYGMGDCSICFLSELIAEVVKEENIEIFTNTEIEKVTGEVGNFKIDLIKKPRYVDVNRCTGCKQCEKICPHVKNDEYEFGLKKRTLIHIPFVHSYPYAAVIDEEDAKTVCKGCFMCEATCINKAIDLDQKEERLQINVGVKVIAIGADLNDDLSEYGYEPNKDIITSAEFERILSSDGPTGGNIVKLSDGTVPRSISILQCIKPDETMPDFYNTLVMKYKSSIKLRVPSCKVNIFYPIHRLDENKPLLNPMDDKNHYILGSIKVIKDDKKKYVLADGLRYESDIIVLNTNFVPNKDLIDLRQSLDFTLNPNGFMSEDTLASGIFGLGTIMGPLDYHTTVSQANQITVQIISMLSKEYLVTEATGVEIDELKCGFCGLCTISCPFAAITIENDKISLDRFKCKGCGTCVSVCPTNAIQMNIDTTDKISKTIEILSKSKSEIKIIAFCCQSCGYAAADDAGLKKITYDPNIFIVRVPCTGRIDANFLIKSFEMGFDGVMVIGCKKDACKYIDGVEKARKKIELVKEILGEDVEHKLMFETLNVVEGQNFADLVNKFKLNLYKITKGINTKKKLEGELITEA
ncbi:MAG: hydrogenase iron-sulfur subunit [Candidatus Lokiarchaeota archaeon]|nr:hydrogenase iron-sulfur subunit [Candidatus Lokiarchaeota archaeon]